MIEAIKEFFSGWTTYEYLIISLYSVWAILVFTFLCHSIKLSRRLKRDRKKTYEYDPFKLDIFESAHIVGKIRSLMMREKAIVDNVGANTKDIADLNKKFEEFKKEMQEKSYVCSKCSEIEKAKKELLRSKFINKKITMLDSENIHGTIISFDQLKAKINNDEIVKLLNEGNLFIRTQIKGYGSYMPFKCFFITEY